MGVCVFVCVGRAVALEGLVGVGVCVFICLCV